MNYQTHNFAQLFKLTDLAAKKIKQLLEAETEIEAVRIYVAGGGCSGMNYSMSFAKQQETNDIVVENQGARIYLDPVAASLLTGVEVDFKDDELSSSFIFNNSFNMLGGSGGCTACGSNKST